MNAKMIQKLLEYTIYVWAMSQTSIGYGPDLETNNFSRFRYFHFKSKGNYN